MPMPMPPTKVSIATICFSLVIVIDQLLMMRSPLSCDPPRAARDQEDQMLFNDVRTLFSRRSTQLCPRFSPSIRGSSTVNLTPHSYRIKQRGRTVHWASVDHKLLATWDNLLRAEPAPINFELVSSYVGLVRGPISQFNGDQARMLDSQVTMG